MTEHLQYLDRALVVEPIEPFFELRLPDGRSVAAFVSNFDIAATSGQVTIAGLGKPCG